MAKQKKVVSEEAKALVLEQFNGFRQAYVSAVQKARQHGEALVKLQAECNAAGASFTKTLDDLGIPRSTAYDHRKLYLVWDDAQKLVKEMGLRGELLGIFDLIRLVDEDYKRTPDKEEKAAQEARKAENQDKPHDEADPPEQPTPERTDPAEPNADLVALEQQLVQFFEKKRIDLKRVKAGQEVVIGGEVFVVQPNQPLVIVADRGAGR